MAATKLEVVSASGARKNQVYHTIKCFSVESLGDLVRVLMDGVDDVLFELSGKADNDKERNLYFEAMREFRLKGDGLKQQFRDEMEQSFERVFNGKAAIAEAGEEDELTLIELDELEDNIPISNMVARARPHFEDELFAVSERLKLVLRRKDVDDDENPIDPKAICQSFHNASALLDTDIQVNLIFYKLFERCVIGNLGHFYKEVNELLAEKGVLPGFKADQERMKQTTRFMANRIKKNASHQAGAAVGPVDAGDLYATLQQALGSPGYAASAIPTGADATLPAAGGTGQFATGEFVSALTELQATALVNQPLEGTDPQNMRAATQQQLLAFREQNQQQLSSNDSQTIDVVSMLFDFFFADEALPAPIKVLIGRLQIPILKVAIIDREFFNQKKHPARKLLDSISRASLGWSDNHDDGQGLIDKTEQIVNFLINEFDDDIGVFEEALIDFENFVKQEARTSEEAVKALQQQENAGDLHIQNARDAADQLIAKLTRNRELSFEVTDFLETTWSSVLFNTYLSLGESSNQWRNLKRISTTFVWTLVPRHCEEDRKRIIKTIPALLRALSKGMELVNIKTEVQNRIFKMLANEHSRIVKLTSKNIVTRVDDETVWPEDGGAAAFAKAQGIDPAQSPGIELSIDGAGESQLVEKSEDDDSITVIDLTSTSEVIDDLNQFTADVASGQVKVSEEIVMQTAEGEELDLIDEEEDHLEQAQALEIGDWVEFTDLITGKSLAARLSWKSKVTTGNLEFVNRRGQKVRNFTIHGLAMELRAGRASRIESSSVCDRVIYSIVSKVQK